MPENELDERAENRSEGLMRRAATAMEGLGNRLAAAEAALEELEGEVGLFAELAVDTIEKLATWEHARRQLFIYSDETDFVLAYGRATLDEFRREDGYDAYHSDWNCCEPETELTIWVDEDGNPCPIGEGTQMTKTIAQWLAQAKERQYDVQWLDASRSS